MGRGKKVIYLAARDLLSGIVVTTMLLMMEMDQGKLPCFVIFWVVSLTLQGFCSHTAGQTVIVCTDHVEPNIFCLLQICVAGSACLWWNKIFCSGSRTLRNWMNFANSWQSSETSSDVTLSSWHGHFCIADLLRRWSDWWFCLARVASSIVVSHQQNQDALLCCCIEGMSWCTKSLIALPPFSNIFTQAIPFKFILKEVCILACQPACMSACECFETEWSKRVADRAILTIWTGLRSEKSKKNENSSP